MLAGEFVACDFQSNLTHHLADLLFQFTYTAFPGMILNDVFDGSLGKLDMFFFQSVGIHFFRNQVTAGNLDFFFGDISAYLDQLHTVQQRGRDRSQIVGRGDEHHF